MFRLTFLIQPTAALSETARTGERSRGLNDRVAVARSAFHTKAAACIEPIEKKCLVRDNLDVCTECTAGAVDTFSDHG